MASTSPRPPRCPPTSAASAEFGARRPGVVAGLARRRGRGRHGVRRGVERLRLPASPTATGSRAAPRSLGSTAPTRLLLTAERSALNLRVPPVGRRHAHPSVGRRARRHRVPGPRHAQDDCRACGRCRSTAVRCGGGAQPPHGAQRRRAGEGQPRARRRRRGRGVRRGARRSPRRSRSRSRSTRSTGCARRSTRAPTWCCSTTSSPSRWCRRSRIRDEMRPRRHPRGERWADARDRSSPSARPGSTTSRSVSSPTRSKVFDIGLDLRAVE